MSTARHTSGPWTHRAMTMPKKAWAALGRGIIQIVTSNGDVIAAVWPASDKPGEAEANAVLIAACTDMMDALQGFQTAWDAGRLLTSDEAAALRVALAKALGDS